MNQELLDGLKAINTPEKFWPNTNREKVTSVLDPNPTNDKTGTTNTQNSGSKSDSVVNTNLKPIQMDNVACKAIKTITKTVGVVINTVAGNNDVTINFGTEYKKIVGLYAIITSLGGLTIAQIKLGLSDTSRTIIDPTAIEHFTVSTAVAIKDRFYKEPIEINGGNLSVRIVNAATFTAAFEVQIIAQVEKPA